MYFIKLVNEMDSISYDSPVALSNLLNYVFSPAKTDEDTIRPVWCLKDLSGCEPFFFPKEFEHDPSVIYSLMLTNDLSYSLNVSNIAKHRVISFDCSEYVVPSDLDPLGRAIVRFYTNYGYIAAYAVHRDNYQCHVHVVVNTISFSDGHRFHIKNEWMLLNDIIDRWYEAHNEKIIKDPNLKEWYENILFGMDIAGFSIPLSAKEQIQRNNNYKRK